MSRLDPIGDIGAKVEAARDDIVPGKPAGFDELSIKVDLTGFDDPKQTLVIEAWAGGQRIAHMESQGGPRATENIAGGKLADPDLLVFTCGGNTWTALTTSNVASDVGSKLYYCLAPTTNAAHTFTFGPANVYGGLIVAAFSGVKTSSPFDQQTGATSSSASALSTGSVTPSEDNELVIFAAGKGGNTTTVNATDVGSMIGSYAGITAVTYAQGMGYEIQTTATARNPSLSGSGTSVMAALSDDGTTMTRAEWV